MQTVFEKAFQFSDMPMLLLSAEGRIVDTNVALRLLFREDVNGCIDLAASELSTRLAVKTDGELLPAATSACKMGPRYGDVDRWNCTYASPAIGRTFLRGVRSCLYETADGTPLGSLITLNPVELAVDPTWQAMLTQRRRHEIMWELYAVSYDRIQLQLPFYRETLARHLAALRSVATGHVLDVGAGTGNAAVELVRSGFAVTAVDTSRAMLDRLRMRAAGLEDMRQLQVIEGTAERLPQLADASFDAVNAMLTFFDMDDPRAALRECARLLRTGGPIVITEPRKCFDVDQLMAAAKQCLVDRGVFVELQEDWTRIENAAPQLDDRIMRREGAMGSSNRPEPWSAEDCAEAAASLGLDVLAIEDSHLGNCATIRAVKR